MKVLVLDNYDSFTYNLVHLVRKIMHGRVDVIMNDQVEMEAVEKYDKILLSPGPGIPSEAGLMLPLIKAYASSKSILGVCLGHQAIGEAFGGRLINLSTVYHGVSTPVLCGNKLQDTTNNIAYSSLFKGLPAQILVGRYHSWIVEEEHLPSELQVTARDENGYIMAMQHTSLDVRGVQFHPESVLTPEGENILRNWLDE